MALDILVRTNPPQPQAGEAFRLQLLLRHPMETGLRRDASGALIPENYIEQLEVFVDEERLSVLRLTGGVSANPLIILTLSLERSGVLRCAYRSSTGQEGEVRHALELV
jgi:sulfur-oxidizing protein SoxZ